MGEAWTHEIKYDGYRTQIHMAGAEARAFTRNGHHDWSMKYAAVLAGVRALIRRDAILDGEMVVQDETGRSDFKRLVSAIRWESASLVFCAFDLLSLDGKDLRQKSCQDRRARLQNLVGIHRPDVPVQFSEAFNGAGAELFAAAERMGLEGIVSKRKASIYRSGPPKDWLKIKTYIAGEFVIIGYERKRGEAPSLLLANIAESVGQRYVGRAIPVITGQARDELWQALEFLQTDTWSVNRGPGNRGAVPVRPVMRVMAKHLRGEEKLRHATVAEILGP